MAGDSFTTKCSKCGNPMTFTMMKINGEKVPNPEKPGKFKWNPPVDADGERHQCNSSYKGMKKTNCIYCGELKCICTYTSCPLCEGPFGYFRNGDGSLSKHLKEGYHYDIHGYRK